MAVAPVTGRLIDFTPELRAEAIEIVEPYVKISSAVGPRRGTGRHQEEAAAPRLGRRRGMGRGRFDPETGMLCVPPVTDAFAADLTPGNPDRACGRMAVDAKTALGL